VTLKIEQDKLDLFNKYVYACSDEHTEYIDLLIRIYEGDFRKDCFTQALLDEYDNVMDIMDEYNEDNNYAVLYNFKNALEEVRKVYGEHDIEHYLTLFKNGG
jgi:hypothetical protein